MLVSEEDIYEFLESLGGTYALAAEAIKEAIEDNKIPIHFANLVKCKDCRNGMKIRYIDDASVGKEIYYCSHLKTPVSGSWNCGDRVSRD